MDIVSCRDFAVDQVGEFARHQAITSLSLSLIQLEKHNTVKVQEILEKAFKVGPRPNSTPYSYWKEAETRTEVRRCRRWGDQATRHQYRYPWHRQAALSQGFRHQRAHCLHGRRQKKGKSFTIWDFAKLISLQGYNVLGITLEVSTEVLSTRLDASVSDTPIDEIEGSIFAVMEAIRATRDRKLPRRTHSSRIPVRLIQADGLAGPDRQV